MSVGYEKIAVGIQASRVPFSRDSHCFDSAAAATQRVNLYIINALISRPVGRARFARAGKFAIYPEHFALGRVIARTKTPSEVVKRSRRRNLLAI